jgi:hypothetical protein
MTHWWHDKSVSALGRKAVRSGPTLEDMLEAAICNELGREENNEVMLRQSLVGDG